MENFQKRYIQKNLENLVSFTTCHSLFLSYLESKNVIRSFETALLDSIGNRLDKSRKFFEIIATREKAYEILCEALKETKQTGALEILSELNPIRFDVRQPVHLFTGREEELHKLHECIISQNQRTATVITQAASVTGLGGIGKTELCRRYIQLYSQEYDNNVVWIGAETPAQMENSFRTLAKDYLKISQKDADGGEKNIKTVVDEVYNFFSKRGNKCLFVFDNAESNNSKLNMFLPVRVIKRPSLIITSRDRDWEAPFNVLVLEELKVEEAIEFVKKGLSISKNDRTLDEIIIKLVTTLQRFPLALQQAISFIKEHNTIKKYEISEYLQLFQTQGESLLDHKISKFLSNKYAKTTFTTWKITINVIAADKKHGNLATTMLNLFSYFEPDKIPLELILRHENIAEDEIHYALQLLVKYSLINCQPLESMFGIHRLVQEVTRMEIRIRNDEQNILDKCLNLFNQRMIENKSLSHAMKAFNFAQLHSSLIITFSSMLTKILKGLKRFNRLNESRRYGKTLIKVFSKNLPASHIDIGRAEFELGLVLVYQQKFEKGYTTFKKVLQNYKVQDSSIVDETDIEEVLKIMCTILIGKGEWEKAETQCIDLAKSITKRIKMHKLLHFRDLEAFARFNLVLSRNPNNIRKYDQFIQNHLLLVGWYKQLYGEENEMVSWRLMELAILYGNNNNVEKALACSKIAYERNVNSFDTNIYLTGFGFVHAQILLKAHKPQEAIYVADKVYNCRGKVFGFKNYLTLESMSQLGECKRQLGLYDEAIELLQKCYACCITYLGEKNDMTFVTGSYLLLAKAASGHYDDDANMLFYKLLNQYFDDNQAYNVRKLNIQFLVAGNLCNMGAFSLSLKLFLKMRNIVVKKFGEDKCKLRSIDEEIALCVAILLYKIIYKSH